MNGKGARQKGLSFERAMAKDLRAVYPNAKRHLECQMDEAYGKDLENTGPFVFQCKRLKKYVPISTFKEITCGQYEIPVLISKADNEATMAVLKWEHLLTLIKVYNENCISGL